MCCKPWLFCIFEFIIPTSFIFRTKNTKLKHLSEIIQINVTVI